MFKFKKEYFVRAKREKKINGNQEFYELCAYIEREFYGYDCNQHLKQPACLWLRGLMNGKEAGGWLEVNGVSNYPIKCALIAFQINRIKIINALQGKEFKSEESRMRYICSIVKDDIDNVYMRLKRAEQTKESIEKLDTNILSYNGGEYQKKTEELKNKRLNELW